MESSFDDDDDIIGGESVCGGDGFGEESDEDEYSLSGMDSFEVPVGKVVRGYMADEYVPEVSYDRGSYTNVEISEHLGSYFRFFGMNDMDIIFLYFLSRKRQDELIGILHKTQPAISYDVTRIRNQLSFVVKVISYLDDFILFITDEDTRLSTHERELLTVFLFSTSIVKTAKILGLNHITCRTHLINTIERLGTMGYEGQYEFFNYIYSNLNRVKKSLDRE